ncbi:MAG: hypothetical protein ACOH15_04875 [Acetobacterium sp.]
MIYRGDIIRLYNPSEIGLKTLSHMHIVENIVNNNSNCKRSFAVCTSSPTRYIKEGVPFLPVEGEPFKKKTYIRLDPMFTVKNVKIKTNSRTKPIYRLNKDTEDSFFTKVNSAKEEELDKNEFLKLNPLFVESI